MENYVSQIRVADDDIFYKLAHINVTKLNFHIEIYFSVFFKTICSRLSYTILISFVYYHDQKIFTVVSMCLTNIFTKSASSIILPLFFKKVQK